jgi:dihydroorotate dehydrogenase electron transfer subunit
VLPAGAVALETGEFQIATEDGSDGREGVVTDLLADQIEKGDRKRLRIFACGPRPMLIRVAAMARENRIPCQVSLEAAMACGVGACQGCAIKASPGGDRPYLHVCTDGPVFPIEAVDWGSL